jgi:hypothetical protein
MVVFIEVFVFFFLRLYKAALADTKFYGSERESDRVPILGGFLESDHFGLGSGHALRLQK